MEPRGEIVSLLPQSGRAWERYWTLKHMCGNHCWIKIVHYDGCGVIRSERTRPEIYLAILLEKFGNVQQVIFVGERISNTLNIEKCMPRISL